MKLLQSGWFCALVGAMSYLGTMVVVWQPPHLAPPAPPASVAAKPEPKPSWEFYSPEADELIGDLRAQRETLAARERDLQEWEARLKAERDEIKTVMANIEQQRAEFDRVVVRVREEEVANLKRLAKMYAAMAPENAVAVLKEMKDDEIVKILAFMKDAQASPILETLATQGQADARRAAQITERIRVSLSAIFPEKSS